MQPKDGRTTASLHWSLNDDRSIGLRVWHWLNAVVLIGLLLTVGLRKTLFSARRNARLFEARAVVEGITLDSKVALAMARDLTRQLWAWHVNLGYALAALLLLRLVIVMFRRDRPWPSAIFAYRQFRQSGPALRVEAREFALLRILYSSFYLVVLFMVISGLTMVYHGALGLSEDTVHEIHEVHEALLWYFLGFIGLHLAGVVRAELGRFRGLVSSMIHGRGSDRS